MARRAQFGEAPRCFANRGANGIDGALSSYLGVSRDAKEAWGIFGDLTVLYDLNAPAILFPFLRRIIADLRLLPYCRL